MGKVEIEFGDYNYKFQKNLHDDSCRKKEIINKIINKLL